MMMLMMIMIIVEMIMMIIVVRVILIVLDLVPFALRDAFRSLSGCSSGRVPHWVDCKTAGGVGDCLSECPALVVIVRTLSGQLSEDGVVGKISGSPGQLRSLVS